MILIPSRGRPQWLAKFFQAGVKEPGIVMLDDDDASTYQSISLPENWSWEIKPRTTIGQRWNEAFKDHKDEPHYALMTDDAEPMTKDWDSILASEVSKRKVVWPDDLYQQRSTFPWVRGDIARGIGFLAVPCLKHLYIDTFWGDLVDGKGLVSEVKVKHHYQIDDETHRTRQDGNDNGNYTTFRNTMLNEMRLHVA